MRWSGASRSCISPIVTQPSTGEAAEKDFALSEAKPSLQNPGSFEERRASRLRRDQWRVPFLWFVSLGKQRNEQYQLCRNTWLVFDGNQTFH